MATRFPLLILGILFIGIGVIMYNAINGIIQVTQSPVYIASMLRGVFVLSYLTMGLTLGYAMLGSTSSSNTSSPTNVSNSKSTSQDAEEEIQDRLKNVEESLQNNRNK